MQGLISIPTQVKYDINYLKTEKNNHWQMYFIFKESMCVAIQCETDGSIKYHSPVYYATRVTLFGVELLDSRLGWQVDEQATKIYFDQQAEAELLK